MTLEWTSRARSDLIAIRAFISRESDESANRFIEKILQTAMVLETSPRAERVLPELRQDSIRELILGNLRFVYTLSIDIVSILTMFELHRVFKGSLF